MRVNPSNSVPGAFWLPLLDKARTGILAVEQDSWVSLLSDVVQFGGHSRLVHRDAPHQMDER